jgi:F0F1-type ATP synthase membrane subunit b/b'
MRWRSPKPDESKPTLDDLGTRVEQILGLAERQAEDHRAAARREAEEIVAAARQEAEQILAAARREARRITDGT